MLGLLISMAALGFSAIDPIGIGLVLLLLTQKNPYLRSTIFLLGSFFALLFIGFLFAQGLGVFILRTEEHHHWLAPSFQIIAGVVLIMFGLFGLAQKNQQKDDITPKSLTKYLDVTNLLLFVFGFVLVIAQSIIDVVFVVAMTHVARMHLSRPELAFAILIYTLAALSIQIVVVIIYSLTPAAKQQKFITKSNGLIKKYGTHTTVTISMVLGIILCVNALLMVSGRPHF